MATEARRALRPGGAVRPGDLPTPSTGGWRTGRRPAVDLSRCVNCLLCWIHCPDIAVRHSGGAFGGFDYDLCKGCEICAEVCPVSAISMVPEEVRLGPGGVLPGLGGAGIG